MPIIAVEVRNCTGEQAILRGEARILVFGRFFRHVDRAGHQTGQNIGMQTLDQCLVEMVRRNMVNVAEATTRAVNKDLFMG